MRIYLDDVRTPPMFDNLTGEKLTWDLIARTAGEIIPLIQAGKVTYISFDHDLGEGLTGYDVAGEIEKQAAAGMIGPIDYDIHSANPVGANNIDAAMKSAWRFWDKAKS
jgi:hypothetical protein